MFPIASQFKKNNEIYMTCCNNSDTEHRASPPTLVITKLIK